jgi:hypothetical protein
MLAADFAQKDSSLALLPGEIQRTLALFVMQTLSYDQVCAARENRVRMHHCIDLLHSTVFVRCFFGTKAYKN